MFTPQRFGGRTRRDDDMLLRGDGSCIGAFGQLIDRAASHPVGVSDGPSYGVAAAVQGQQTRMITSGCYAGAGTSPSSDEGVRMSGQDDVGLVRDVLGAQIGCRGPLDAARISPGAEPIPSHRILAVRCVAVPLAVLRRGDTDNRVSLPDNSFSHSDPEPALAGQVNVHWLSPTGLTLVEPRSGLAA